MKPRLVCFSLPFESATFLQKIVETGLEKELIVSHFGVGKETFLPALKQSLAAHKPASVVLAGFCAGIHPHARTGSIFRSTSQETSNFPATCWNEENIDTPVSSQGSVLGELCAGVHSQTSLKLRGSLVSVNDVLETVEDKARLARCRPDILAADMETIPALGIVRAYRIPCSVLRVVSDGADVDLPLPTGVLFDQKKQKTLPVRLFGYLLAHPASCIAFLKFVRSVHLARKVLADELIAMPELTKMP
jgi:nucleoside phosphorylase